MKSVTLNVPTGLAKEFAAEMAALCKKYEVETDGLKYLIPVTERIKTFEDALNELGESNILVRQYRAIVDADDELELDCNDGKDVIALLKLRIICTALNEGWTPKFTTDEYRYYPYFVFYTQSEIDEMDEEDRSRVLGRSYNYANAYAGVAYSGTNYASVSSHTSCGARLCFFKRELAVYAGKQFLKEWSDLIMFTK